MKRKNFHCTIFHWLQPLEDFLTLHVVSPLSPQNQLSWTKHTNTHKYTHTAGGARKPPLNYQPLITALNTSCFSVNDWIKALIKMHLTRKKAVLIHISLKSQLKQAVASVVWQDNINCFMSECHLNFYQEQRSGSEPIESNHDEEQHITR